MRASPHAPSTRNARPAGCAVLARRADAAQDNVETLDRIATTAGSLALARFDPRRPMRRSPHGLRAAARSCSARPT